MFSKLSFNETMLVTITGLVIVFGVLILLVIIFSLYGKLYKSADNKKTENVKEKIIKESVYAVSSQEEEELIAVITAAAMSVLESTGKNYKVTSIKRSYRRPEWATAGILRNTKSF